jgi:large subunit ribosomal protein L3
LKSALNEDNKMSIGLVGRKIGMTRIFTDDGVSIPVTVLDVSHNRVSQVKTTETDGYSALQVAYGVRKPGRITKPIAGHLAKSGVDAAAGMMEFLVGPESMAGYQPGTTISVEIFSAGQMVDVSGVTQGKGFAGTIKRHHFKSQRATHGNSRSHNVPGSIGQAQDPGRIFPGKRMSGHLGAVNRTIQNLEIVRVDLERQLLLVKGAVPGSKGGNVVVRPAVKGVA